MTSFDVTYAKDARSGVLKVGQFRQIIEERTHDYHSLEATEYIEAKREKKKKKNKEKKMLTNI